MNKASCHNLLSNAVRVWNNLAITKTITLLRGAGETIPDEDLARISPLIHQHVIPNGTYHFALLSPETTLHEPGARVVNGSRTYTSELSWLGVVSGA